MKILILALSFISFTALGQGSYEMAVLKYQGGGDWYANPTALPNLIEFVNKELETDFKSEPAQVDVGSPELFNFPFIHMTGHGNVVFSGAEAENLRTYLIGGGFLHIDDNYGMDAFIRPEMKKVFPELEFVEIPFDHSIYQKPFVFPAGPPKVHEHDGLPAQGLGLFYDGRLVVYYTYQSDLGDGWEDQSVHKDSQETRLKALKMGANLVYHALISTEL